MRDPGRAARRAGRRSRHPDHPWHPWRRFAGLDDWTLRWDRLPEGVMGQTCHATRTVTLALGMSQAERRCTIAHETEHILRGPGAPHGGSREELAIDRTVATLLVPSLARLADAIVAAEGDLEAVADQLWVDDYVLEARLGALAGWERDVLRRRLRDLR